MSRKILVIDDDVLTVRLLKEKLKQKGFDVEEAYDGLEGLNKARDTKPDLIILDAMMPNMNGYEVARLLRFDQQFKETPIIMLSGRSEASDRELGKKVGITDYVAKPIKTGEFIAVIKEMIDEMDELMEN